MYQYLRAEVVLKEKMPCIEIMSSGLGGEIFLPCIEQQSICWGSMDVYFFISVDVLES